METVIVFGDPRSLLTTVLLEQTLRVARQHDNLQVIAVCDAGRSQAPPRWVKASRLVLRFGLRRLFDAERPIFLRKPLLSDLYAVSRRFGVRVLIPPERNINHPEFVQYLRHELKPTFALSYSCLQIFSRELLDVFEAAVNYHNGLLPHYRGLLATAWSVYQRETTTGLTFHYMSEEVDGGPIVLQAELPVVPGKRPLVAEYEKTCLAADCIERVLDALVKRAPGQPQSGPRSYFGKKDSDAIRSIADPARYTWPELQRRLEAFGSLNLRFKGEGYQVTKLVSASDSATRPRGLSFVTADGIPVTATRVSFLPLPLYRVVRAVKRAAAKS